MTRVTLALAFVALVGCASKAPIALDPSEAEIQATRQLAIRVADATTAGLVVVDEVGKLSGQLPIPADLKNGIDCAVIKATGTTQPPSQTVRDVCQPLVGDLPNGPGPLHTALGTLGAITAMPSLKTTVSEIVGAIEPLIAKLEASKTPALATFGSVLRATFAITKTVLGGGQ